MSAKDDSVVRVPIEIKTEDISEIQNLLQKITEAEGELGRIKSTGITKGALPQTMVGQARRAGGQGVTTEGRGGIFDSQEENISLPMSSRDRSGKQPIQRENKFTNLEKQVQGMQEANINAMGGIVDQMVGMGTAYIPFVGGSRILGSGQKHLMNKIKQKAAQAQQMGGGATPPVVPMGVRAAGLLARVGSIAGAAGPLGVAVGTVIAGILATKAFMDWMQGPGGFWDVRYKRNINKEMDPFLERREKQEINIGLRIIRVTSSPAARGGNQIFSTAHAVKKGIPIYNGEFEAYSKGLYID